MEVGYSARCKLCNSEHRAEVERRKEQGDSLAAIVAFMKQHGESISKTAVHRHFVEHFPVKQEAAKRYAEQSQTVLTEAVDKRLTDVEMLDELIARSMRMNAAAMDHISESLNTDYPVLLKNGKPLLDAEYKPVMRKGVPAKQMVELFNGTAAEVRQALRTKDDLIGDGENDKPTRVMIVDDLDELDES